MRGHAFDTSEKLFHTDQTTTNQDLPMIAKIRSTLILCLLFFSLCSCLTLLFSSKIRDGKVNELNPAFQASLDSRVLLDQ